MKRMISYILCAIFAFGSIIAVSASPAGTDRNAVTEQTKHHKHYVKRHWKRHKIKIRIKHHKKHVIRKHH